MATAAIRNVTIRLPNSMTPWMPSSPCGVKDSSVHRGQVGQPSPEPVSRTTPPVTTIRMLAAREAQARGRIHAVGPHGSAHSHLNVFDGQDGADRRPGEEHGEVGHREGAVEERLDASLRRARPRAAAGRPPRRRRTTKRAARPRRRPSAAGRRGSRPPGWPRRGARRRRRSPSAAKAAVPSSGGRQHAEQPGAPSARVPAEQPGREADHDRLQHLRRRGGRRPCRAAARSVAAARRRAA